MSKRYPPEQRARAVRWCSTISTSTGRCTRACQAIGPKVGVGVESLRQWTVQAQIDAQQGPGPTSAERQRSKTWNGSRAWVGNG
jgi:transposase